MAYTRSHTDRAVLSGPVEILVDLSCNSVRATLAIHQIRKLSRGGLDFGSPTQRLKQTRRLPPPIKEVKVSQFYLCT